MRPTTFAAIVCLCAAPACAKRATGPSIVLSGDPTTEAFMDGQRFRAGSEGSISVLKRAFNLGKCFFKGFKNYAASVGLAVLCHNLVLLARS